MATQFDQGVVVPLTTISDPFGLKPLTSNFLVVNTVPQKSLFINITGSLSNIVIPNSINRPMSASLVVSSATGDPTNNILAHEVLFSTTTSGNLTIPSANISIPITSSFNLNDKIILRVVGNNNSFTTNNIIDPTSFDSNLSLNITSTPNPSNTNMILEPYFEGRPFVGSDADVTSGDIFRNIPNPFLQDIDYNRGPIPVNNQALISGSAERGTVPQSFFTMGGMINPSNSAINQVDKYNVSGSSFNSQTSGGTFVVYYSDHYSAGGTNLTLTDFNLKYIITPDGEAIQITNSDESLDFLRRLFGSQVNPEGLKDNGNFGANDREVNTRAMPISGSGVGSEMKYKGPSSIFEVGSQIKLRAKTFSSSYPGAARGGAGIVYPASIELTSHADLPSKARQILTENNIIPPES